ncbi:hypothetical protein MHYP_G00225990 [Metynnis hypsauchen]
MDLVEVVVNPIPEDLGVHFGPDSQQSQARHYHTLQEMLKRLKPNKEAVAQLLDLEFDARRAFINSDTLRDQDRPANILQAYPCFKEVDHASKCYGLRGILHRSNPDFISDLKTRWERFYGKAQFYGVFKKVLRSPTTQDKSPQKTQTPTFREDQSALSFRTLLHISSDLSKVHRNTPVNTSNRSSAGCHS